MSVTIFRETVMITFKPRGRGIQVVRPSGADEGDGGAESLGTVKLPDYAPDTDLAAKLTPDEARQLTAHAERCLRAEDIAREHAAYSLTETLRLATEWLKAADKTEALDFAEAIRSPFGRLRRLVAKIAVNEADEL